MTKHEADVIGGLNMTDQISNEAYKQIMIAADDEVDKSDVLDKIRAEIDEQYDRVHPYNISCAEGLEMALEIIDKYKTESEEV